MAKYEKQFKGDFREVLSFCENIILDRSISATLEDSSDFIIEDVKIAVRVYERYSYIGDNRVSLNLTLVGKGEDIMLSAITSGGSQALFFKINTFGEGAFLQTLSDGIEEYIENQ